MFDYEKFQEIIENAEIIKVNCDEVARVMKYVDIDENYKKLKNHQKNICLYGTISYFDNKGKLCNYKFFKSFMYIYNFLNDYDEIKDKHQIEEKDLLLYFCCLIKLDIKKDYVNLGTENTYNKQHNRVMTELLNYKDNTIWYSRNKTNIITNYNYI